MKRASLGMAVAILLSLNQPAMAGPVHAEAGLSGGLLLQSHVGVGLEEVPLSLVGQIHVGVGLSWSAWARTTELLPTKPAWGLVLGAYQVATGARCPANMDGSPVTGCGLSPVVGLYGLTYQQAWGDYWFRLSPTMYWPPNADWTSWQYYVLGGPPMAEAGWRGGPNWGVTLRLSATPVGLDVWF